MVGFRLLAMLVLLLVAALGVLAVWMPFGIDQAIFVYGGRTVTDTGVLYRDFWDIKPPGIFLFYGFAGALAGFDEPGIHTLELFWQLALAAALLRIAWLLAAHEHVAVLAPLVTLGCYWTWGQAPHLTQVEALVGLPIAGSLLLADRISRHPGSKLAGVLFGATAGVLLALKPIYLLFPLAFGLSALRRFPSRSPTRPPGRPAVDRHLVARLTVWATAGLALIWIPLLLYFAVEGTLGEMLRTTFIYPREALEEVPAAPIERLLAAAGWCVRIFAPYLPLLLAGAWAVWRRRRESTLALGVGLYLLIAAAAIVVQKTSWWEYHFVLLFPPLGLLTSLGLDLVLSQKPVRGLPRAARYAVLLALLALPGIDLSARVATHWSELDRARSLTTDAPLPVRLDPEYLKIWEKTRFLRETRPERAGPIYVFGDFRMQLLSGRQQAIAVRGHAWQHLPERLWRTLPDELITAQPAYLFVGGSYRKLLQRRSPDFWQYLEDHYRPVRRHGSGRWYQRRVSTHRTDRVSFRDR